MYVVSAAQNVGFIPTSMLLDEDTEDQKQQ